MASTTKRNMTATLPATPCYPEMREKLERVAKKNGKSLADQQREAFAFFLAMQDTKCVIDDTSDTQRTGGDAGDK